VTSNETQNMVALDFMSSHTWSVKHLLDLVGKHSTTLQVLREDLHKYQSKTRIHIGTRATYWGWRKHRQCSITIRHAMD